MLLSLFSFSKDIPDKFVSSVQIEHNYTYASHGRYISCKLEHLDRYLLYAPIRRVSHVIIRKLIHLLFGHSGFHDIHSNSCLRIPVPAW
jgi:hypothetical protein